MKPGAAQVTSLIRQPPAQLGGFLFYGPDDGLVRERAESVVRAVLGGAGDDPFRLTQLTPDAIRQDPARLADELRSLSLIGGRRVVRVREAGDLVTKALTAARQGLTGDALLVVEAGDLGKASSLRRWAEEAPDLAAIACYLDGPRERAQLIRETLAADKITISEEAEAYLVTNLGSDRMVTRQELEKLSLLAGPGGRIGLEEAIASVGDSSALAIDQVIFDALDGLGASVDAALARLFLEGESAVAILRAAQRHGQRLHLASSLVAGGESAESAMRALRPPVFVKLADRFRRQLADWPPARCQRLLRLLLEAELDCKRTGFPDQTVCRRLLTTAGHLPGRPGRR